ncbi:MAG: hypothetical protein E7521_06335 [Ruminococcaceae bacterium]|nr:hypothetical protein [Oscillospiraceae bacterium]
MKLNITLKKVICFLLAVLMLLGTVACKDTGGKKKIIKKKKKKVIIVTNEEPTDNNSSIIIEDGNDEEEEEDKKIRPTRKLPEVAEKKEEYVEPIVPEFDSEYKTLNITNDYVIVWSPEKWENRYESKNSSDGSKRQISETAFTRIAAKDLATFFNEQCGLELKVVRDNTAEAKAATKKILVGNTAFYKSSLAEDQFAVKVVGEDLVFEGGHFAMVEKAVDWFQTVKVEKGKVATLTSKNISFKSYITLNGKRYDYVWGDEFDGKEFNDEDKWAQGTFGLERQDDMLNIFNDPQFQYIENGKLRLTGDRYFDEGNAAIGYATSGQIDTDGKMLFRNGYYEFYARLPYTRGGFPAIWTMTADAVGQENVPNYNYDDGYGVYSKRVWDLEFDLFESFADDDHMTTTIHKWYTNRRNTSISKDPVDLTLEEEAMVEADMLNLKGQDGKDRYNWVYDAPKGYCLATETIGGTAYNMYYYNDNGVKKYVNQKEIDEQKEKLAMGELEMKEEDTWQYKLDNGIIKQAHRRFVIKMDVLQSNGSYKTVDTFKYRLSPFTNMGNSMNTYAYQFSYYGNKGDAQSGLSGSNRRQDDDGVYGDWRWYFDPETINNEYHLYGLHLTSDHCTVSMDGTPFLDFDWDPAYDYKDLDGDGKGDDISNNNNGVGFNFWHYFLIDMMIYTPGNFNIDDYRKLQAGDTPLHLYIDYVRAYQDLDDDSQCIYFPNGEVK